jgi:predicted peroxiredoxin
MKRFLLSFLALMLLAAPLATNVRADNDDPLFVNMTTSDPHRAKMAIVFAKKQQDLNHPVTVFLNDKGVFAGAKSKAVEFKEHQEALAAIMKAGGVVIACPMCMEHYGVKVDDLIEGIQIGKPELTGGQLFKDDTKTLTW